MFDPWKANEGDRVERLPMGEKGTFLGADFYSIPLNCGCCSDFGVRAEVLWDGETEPDFVDADELRALE